MKKKIALVLSAAVILGFGGGGYAYAKTPVAYVSVDINPSVELGVNAFDKVVSVEAYNDDGKKILEGIDLRNYDIENAVSTVISNAISDGYITQDATTTAAVVVEITTSTDKDKVGTKLEESLKDVADKTLNENDIEAEVETEKVALARRDEARKLGITPGKLNLIQKLQALDPTITVEDYKDSSVKDIQKKTKELRKNNKNNEATTENSTSTDTSTNSDITTEEATLIESSGDAEETTTAEPQKNKYNNGNSQKEENSNGNSKKEENSNANNNKQEKSATDTTTVTEKQNNGNNVNSQGNNNSSKSNKSEKSSSGSENKGNGKNKNN